VPDEELEGGGPGVVIAATTTQAAGPVVITGGLLAPAVNLASAVFVPHADEPFDPNVTGTWLMDKARSEPMNAYFRVMGLPELAIEAAAKAEADFDTWNVVQQTAEKFAIKKHARLIHSDECFVWGAELVQTSKIGRKAIRLSLEGDVIVRVTMLPRDRMLEERRRKLDHTTMHIVFTLSGAGAPVVVNRYYTKMRNDAFDFAEFD